MSSYRSLEHHEHSEHIAHSAHEAGHDHAEDHANASANAHAVAVAQGHARTAQWTALLVAFLAAGLAICEQGAKHAEIRVQQQAIEAADSWAQFQAKSTRGTVAKDIAIIVETMSVGGDPAATARRDAAIAKLHADQNSYEHDPKDGKDAIAHRAKEMEHERDHTLEQTHAYHNGSASYELGIVLATASTLTRSKMLFYIACGLGIAGIILSVLGYYDPELGAF